MHVNQDAVFIAGQKCFKFVDDIERMRNAQVVTAANIGSTQWLVNIISYDDNYNVVESVQIQGRLKPCCCQSRTLTRWVCMDRLSAGKL